MMKFGVVYPQSVSPCIHLNYVPPTRGEGGHISFSADPRRRHDSFVSPISLESMGGILPDLH